MGQRRMKHDDHKEMLRRLKQAQEADHDRREQAREAHQFVDAKDGQWEPQWYRQNEGKPRYQFDMVTPIIDQVCGDIMANDFSVSVTPSNGEASEDVAETFEGLVRNIERISSAKKAYDYATKTRSLRALMPSGWCRSTWTGIPSTRIW
jgi:hypothetical protein